MCKIYTQAFVSMNLLAPEHRVGFSRATPAQTQLLDVTRARHEIPLLDLASGEVVYGMDALCFVFGHRFPLLAPVFRQRLFRRFADPLYHFVSYNRRVIAGTAPSCSGPDCAPAFRLAPRLAYLALALVGWAALLFGFWRVALVSGSAAPRLLLTAVVVVQFVALLSGLATRRGWDWLGNAVTNCLMVGLLLLPSLLFRFPAALLCANLVFAVVVALVDARRRLTNLAFTENGLRCLFALIRSHRIDKL